jgi:hypothetical protein
MRILELLHGHVLRETDPHDDPGLGSSTPLATIAAPGADPVVDPGVALARLKPLRRLKHLDRGSFKSAPPQASP